MTLSCFKAYDIRGKIPAEVNTEVIAHAAIGVAKLTDATTLAVGHDVRTTSSSFHEAACTALLNAGYNVLSLGQCATEEVYHAAMHFDVQAGLMITGSHNPIDQNGMKIIRAGGQAFSADDDMPALHRYVAQNMNQPLPQATEHGTNITPKENPRTAYIQHLLSYIDTTKLTPLTIVTNAGNGVGGPILDALEEHLPFTFIKVHNTPDGTFPNGIPNPLLVESRAITLDTLKKHNADLAIAWDGDADRCLLFDEQGGYVSGYYMTGLLADLILSQQPGGKIVHDPRLVWNTFDIIQKHGGQAIPCKAGHGHFKKKLRDEGAIFGGENSGHYFFERFGCCDSGMIPWLLITAHLCQTGQKLSALVNPRKQQFPASEETNKTLGQDASAVLTAVEKHYSAIGGAHFTHLDGLTAEFPDWRFNLRRSSNEPELVRLNVEAKDSKTLKSKETELITLLETF